MIPEMNMLETIVAGISIGLIIFGLVLLVAVIKNRFGL